MGFKRLVERHLANPQEQDSTISTFIESSAEGFAAGRQRAQESRARLEADPTASALVSQEWASRWVKDGYDRIYINPTYDMLCHDLTGDRLSANKTSQRVNRAANWKIYYDVIGGEWHWSDDADDTFELDDIMDYINRTIQG
jgi:hypothetical protein